MGAGDFDSIRHGFRLFFYLYTCKTNAKYPPTRHIRYRLGKSLTILPHNCFVNAVVNRPNRYDASRVIAKQAWGFRPQPRPLRRHVHMQLRSREQSWGVVVMVQAKAKRKLMMVPPRPKGMITHGKLRRLACNNSLAAVNAQFSEIR